MAHVNQAVSHAAPFCWTGLGERALGYMAGGCACSLEMALRQSFWQVDLSGAREARGCLPFVDNNSARYFAVAMFSPVVDAMLMLERAAEADVAFGPSTGIAESGRSRICGGTVSTRFWSFVAMCIVRVELERSPAG